MKLTNGDVGVIGLILLLLAIMTFNYLIAAGFVWFALYVLHAFGLCMATVFTWRLALAACILITLIGMIVRR